MGILHIHSSALPAGNSDLVATDADRDGDDRSG